jgi:hypothetical protein
LVIFFKIFVSQAKDILYTHNFTKKNILEALERLVVKNKKLPNSLEIFHFETFSSGRNIQRIDRAIHTKGVVG